MRLWLRPSAYLHQNQAVLLWSMVNVFAPADYDLLQFAHPRKQMH